MEDTGKNIPRMFGSGRGKAERELREHRSGRLRLAAIIAGICVAAVIAYFIFIHVKTYDNYTVTEEISRLDTPATHYLPYGEGYLKYSNDGASYGSLDNTTWWSQSYGMENPIVSICGSYVAIGNRQGETIYVMDEEGTQSEITVNMSISRIEVASQGTVAVLMEDNGTGYLSLFDRGGTQIAEGALHVENSGVPMDIALSRDGKTLGVSMVDVSSGTAQTTVNFYNFDMAGQDQADNLVAEFTYADTVIPELVCANAGTMLAFADNGVYTFVASNAPEEGEKLEVDGEIQSVFYDDTYFGLVYSDATEDAGHLIEIYDMNCKEKASFETGFAYDDIEFLDNHEISLYNADQCCLFTLRGRQKFTYDFDDDIYGFFHERAYRDYVILKEESTERIRLSLRD